MHILSQFSKDRATIKLSTGVGKVFKITVKVPERTTEYVVGEKEKDFLVGVFKDRAVVEELRIETPESPEE